ncbi:nicotinate (nicotinamide) nucleotide adenylyltransferase [Verruconis gallopava]|uniref:Nicotinamide-nucleotide adenylyltransferase n=1 Tax=Verruconis gallopava TaxID=253628 RepID=A0A0D2APM4_9PEZI|nr:nicotinate (nicotinamide) nucleotide adenylyltransferase [Verruconis gallopava]KIW08643.1 nicotinate (nicotinamide) nucleotide adenylyltransferase [Verruconis gallopava]
METAEAPPTNGAVQSPVQLREHELKDYALPTSRLTMKLGEKDRGRTPLVLCACGSFSPITYLHLRMFEMAKDWARLNTNYVVVGGYLSPVGDAYKKKGLAPAEDRIKMCELAVGMGQEQGSAFIMVDTWEPLQSEYQPTAKVLDHFRYEINERLGGIDDGTGNKIPAKIALLGGADLVETFVSPGVWAEADLDHILCDFGAFVIERAGTDLDDVLSKLKPKWRDNIKVIHQQIRNDVSSTKIRTFLRKDMSIRFLVPDPVIKYIEKKQLYINGEGIEQT